MKLGTFSISFSVKNLAKSKAFYQKLGFEDFAGDESNNYLILKNEETVIGLFQDMFENNILTFNPGWDKTCNKLNDFDDVREIQQSLKAEAIKLDQEVDSSTSGPGSIAFTDPDGNVILIDQHV